MEKLTKHPRLKVDISPKSDVEELEASNNMSEPNEKPNIEEEAEANVLATKSIQSAKASKLDTNKKNITKLPPTPQFCNETMNNLGIRIGLANRLGNGGRTTFRHPKIKSMQT